MRTIETSAPATLRLVARLRDRTDRRLAHTIELQDILRDLGALGDRSGRRRRHGDGLKPEPKA